MVSYFLLVLSSSLGDRLIGHLCNTEYVCLVYRWENICSIEREVFFLLVKKKMIHRRGKIILWELYFIPSVFLIDARFSFSFRLDLFVWITNS